MLIDKPFDVPEEVNIDPQTGLALNIPASRQLYPGWWDDQPEAYNRLKKLRERQGIKIDDFPDGTDRILPKRRYIPMGEG